MMAEEPTPESAAARVSSITIYPVKSCRGISVSEAPITPTGFRWDRQWLIVNSKGRAFTQRNEPKLALVQVELPIQAFTEEWQPTHNSYIAIRAPGMDELKIPLSTPSQVSDGVSVWEWSGSAYDEGPLASDWFSNYLGKPSRLVRFNEDPDYGLGHNIKFSDAFPFLLLSQGSMDALNKLLKEPLSVNRFRPNILVDGCEPFSEDLWKEIKINNSTFGSAMLCYRCKVPNTNQETAEVGPEPTETLKTFRPDKVLFPTRKQQGRVYIGQMLVRTGSFVEGNGNIMKVGDPVHVLKAVPSCADAIQCLVRLSPAVVLEVSFVLVFYSMLLSALYVGFGLVPPLILRVGSPFLIYAGLCRPTSG